MKVIIVLLIAYISCPAMCRAGNGSFDDIVSLIKMKGEATPNEVTSKFGKPSTIEEGHNKHIWHYATTKGDLSIYWDSENEKLEKINFETVAGAQTKVFDNSYAPYIKAGSSKICDVLAVLGIPRNMTIKPVTQELHYSFQNRILHMFFRRGTLVNYSFF
jgi:hypothetical protein